MTQSNANSNLNNQHGFPQEPYSQAQKIKHISGSENISIGITAVVRDKHCRDPTLLIGLQNFFKMLKEKNFLPLLTFIDAVQKQDTQA